MIRNTKLVAKLRASRHVVRKNAEIQTQRNHLDLARPSDAKCLAYLHALLPAHHDQSIGNQFGQQSFDREKELRPALPVIAVKHMTVIRMDKLALTRLADKSSKR